MIARNVPDSKKPSPGLEAVTALVAVSDRKDKNRTG
jgi:hypothetical protein